MRTRIAVLMLLLPLQAAAETVFIEAAQDATLIESSEGELANGSGPVFFVGRTNARANSVRRALVHFDVAAALPRGARIESARLTLFMSPSNLAPREIRLHRLLSDWGEGPSSASGGGGASAESGDSTWLHTYYDDELWVKPGGHFVARASASREVGAPGFYTWEGSRRMVSDVRHWLAAPHRNFGWILIGDETTPQNAKVFASREEPDLALRPVLEVRYSPRLR